MRRSSTSRCAAEMARVARAMWRLGRRVAARQNSRPRSVVDAQNPARAKVRRRGIAQKAVCTTDLEGGRDLGQHVQRDRFSNGLRVQTGRFWRRAASSKRAVVDLWARCSAVDLWAL
mmetsp:Transcript_9817/g.34590  ORF Transcript_9817/g.34590 Transcript_9817/m.34590 type:complete len:117 (-) Transcript_9817:2382-2732(-)